MATETTPIEDVWDSKGNLPTNAIVATADGKYPALDGSLITGLAGGGDMNIAVYDPTAVSGDAFDMDNMAEGATTKILTDAERTKLSGIEASADVTDSANVVAALSGATVASTTIDKTSTVEAYTEKHAASHTISAAECYGGIHYVTSAATITLPPVADGMSVSIVTIGAIAVSVDPNASDLIYLDGTALDDGDKITNTSTAGDVAVLTYFDATGWYATTNSWTDGGA